MYILRERGKGDVGPMAVGCSIALAVTPITKEIEAPVRINKHFGEGSFNFSEREEKHTNIRDDFYDQAASL